MNTGKELAQKEFWKQFAEFNMELASVCRTGVEELVVRFVLKCKLSNKAGMVRKDWQVDVRVRSLHMPSIRKLAATAFAGVLLSARQHYKKIEPVYRKESEGVDKPVNVVLVV